MSDVRGVRWLERCLCAGDLVIVIVVVVVVIIIIAAVVFTTVSGPAHCERPLFGRFGCERLCGRPCGRAL